MGKYAKNFHFRILTKKDYKTSVYRVCLNIECVYAYVHAHV